MESIFWKGVVSNFMQWNPSSENRPMGDDSRNSGAMRRQAASRVRAVSWREGSYLARPWWLAQLHVCMSYMSAL